MDTPDSDREDDYSIASGLNKSLLCNEDTFVDAYAISSESYLDNEIGNEAEASCLLTCCNVSASNCNLNHVDVEGLRDKVAAPCLSRCCENSIIISNKINHVSVNASVNEVTNKSQLAQASLMDNHIEYDVNTLSVADVEPGVAVGEVQMREEERRPVKLSSVEVGLSGGVASFAQRYVDCACVVQTTIAAAPPEAALVAERCPIRVESLVDSRGVIILEGASLEIDIVDVDSVEIDTVDIDSIEIDNVEIDNVEIDNVNIDSVEIDIVDIDNVKIDNVEIDVVDIDSVKIDNVQIDIVDIDSVEIDTVEVDSVEIVAVEGMLPDVASVEIENVETPPKEIACVERWPDAVGPVEVVPVKGMPPDDASVEIENEEILTMEMATVESCMRRLRLWTDCPVQYVLWRLYLSKECLLMLRLWRL